MGRDITLHSHRRRVAVSGGGAGVSSAQGGGWTCRASAGELVMEHFIGADFGGVRAPACCITATRGVQYACETISACLAGHASLQHEPLRQLL